METIKTIAIGVISSIIAAIILELWRANFDWFPSASTPPRQPSAPEPDDRQRNRNRVKAVGFNVLYYATSFLIVYLAIALPPTLKALITGREILLSDARLIGWILPDIPIGQNIATASLLPVVLIVYLPLLFFVGYVAELAAPILNKVFVITIYVWRRFQLVIFICLSALLAIASIWMFSTVTLKEAFMLLVIAIVLIVAMVLSGQEKK